MSGISYVQEGFGEYVCLKPQPEVEVNVLSMQTLHPIGIRGIIRYLLGICHVYGGSHVIVVFKSSLLVTTPFRASTTNRTKVGTTTVIEATAQ